MTGSNLFGIITVMAITILSAVSLTLGAAAANTPATAYGQVYGINYFKPHVKLLGVQKDTGHVKVCVTVTSIDELVGCGVLDTSVNNVTGELIFFEQSSTWNTEVCVELLDHINAGLCQSFKGIHRDSVDYQEIPMELPGVLSANVTSLPDEVVNSTEFGIISGQSSI